MPKCHWCGEPMQKQAGSPGRPVGDLRFHKTCKTELKEKMNEVSQLLERARALHQW